MSRIPAASIDDLDLKRIQRRFPKEAEEIARIRDLLATGYESAKDIVDVSNLLTQVGETRRAESLLRHNIVSEGDLLHEAYIRLFGRGVYEAFEAAIARFSADFSVVLTRESVAGFLRQNFRSYPKAGQGIIDERIAKMLRGPATVEFKFESDGTTADVSSELPEMFHDYVILQLKPEGWKYMSGSVES